MSSSSESSLHHPILSQLPPEDVLDSSRAALDDLYSTAVLKNARATLVIGNPRTGKTELLKLAFDRLFNEHGKALPLYYSLRRDRLAPEKFCQDLLVSFLRQYLAFKNQNADLVQRYELTEKDLPNLASSEDFSILSEILEGFESRVAASNFSALVRYVLGIPQRLAARSNHHLVVFLDEAQWVERVLPGEEFATIFGEILQQPHLVSFVLTGKQRTLLDQLAAEEGLITLAKLLHFGTPDLESLTKLVNRWCAEDGVQTDPETIRLAVQQLDHNIFYLRSIIAAAGERKTHLQNGAEFEQLYAAELLQGRFAHYFSRLLRQVSADAITGKQGEQAAIDVVYICTEAQESRAPIELLKARLKPRLDAYELLTELHRNELVTLLDGHVLPSEDLVFCDWIQATNRRFAGEGIEEVKLELLRRKIKLIPETLAASASRSLHRQMDALLRRFDGQSIARSLFSHDEFVIFYGHATYEMILQGLAAEVDRIELPQVYHVAEGKLFFPRDKSTAGTWSYLAAFGFEQGVYDQEHEIIWLLAVADSPAAIGVDSVTALDAQIAEVEKALVANQKQGQSRIIKWAISKMGFTLDATIELAEKGFATSDFLQLELLGRYCEASKPVSPESETTEEVPAPPPVEEIAAELPAEETNSHLAEPETVQPTIPEVSPESFTPWRPEPVAEFHEAESDQSETEVYEDDTTVVYENNIEAEPAADENDHNSVEYQEEVEETLDVPPPAAPSVTLADAAPAQPLAILTPVTAPVAKAREFELEIPVNDDKEIIAARFAERLARNAGFDSEGVNQIKTALIESCLSLSAAAHSRDALIHQRYHMDDENIVITVANSLSALDDDSGAVVDDEANRLWRLDVLKSLMDDVHLTRVGEGWRVRMARHIPQKP